MEEHADAGIGATLRDAREAQGRSRQDVAEALRARVAQVESLEQEDFSRFGGEVYVRGFLRSYAAEVGLDPGPLLERYNREYGAEEVSASTLITGKDLRGTRGGRSPAWVMWVLIVVVVAAAVGILTSLGSGRTPEQASPDDEPLGPPPTSVPSDDDPSIEDDDGDDAQADADDAAGDDTDASDRASDDTSTQETQDDASGDGSADEGTEDQPQGAEVVLALEDDSWIRVIIDGALYLEETVREGETLQFSGEQIEARFGNAGGVYVELNGEDLGAQGDRGDVVEVVFTSEGAQLQ